MDDLGYPILGNLHIMYISSNYRSIVIAIHPGIATKLVNRHKPSPNINIKYIHLDEGVYKLIHPQTDPVYGTSFLL